MGFILTYNFCIFIIIFFGRFIISERHTDMNLFLFADREDVLLDVAVDDQDHTAERLKSGAVLAAVTAMAMPAPGCNSRPLGAMRYVASASPAFMARHFADGVDGETLARVPSIVFGADDQLQHRFLAGLGVGGGFAHHLCPSSEGFVRLACAGLGWGMVPELQVRQQLASGELVELLPERPLDVPLYWHHWRNGGELLASLTRHLERGVGDWLV